MPGGDKLRRVFFCLLRNREVWQAGRGLLILKRDRRPPMVVMMDFETCAVFCTTQAIDGIRMPYGTLMPSMGSGSKRDRDH